jgi:hypothetical protein
MASVVGLLEERELAARERVEELWEVADRVLAELAEAETAWHEWLIARQRVGEVAATVCAEWQRVRDHTAETGAERYDPDHDTALQHALRRERHRQDVAECACGAVCQACRAADLAYGRLVGRVAEPLYIALDCAGLHVFSGDDRQAVRGLTRYLDSAAVCQVMGWLERTRTVALALCGTGKAQLGGRGACRSQF